MTSWKVNLSAALARALTLPIFFFVNFFFMFFIFFTTLLLGFAGTASAQDFKKQVIYQIVTDRFFNGDTTNDNPSQSAGLFDSTQTNWFAYWGGDLAGIQQKMAYIK